MEDRTLLWELYLVLDIIFIPLILPLSQESIMEIYNYEKTKAYVDSLSIGDTIETKNGKLYVFMAKYTYRKNLISVQTLDQWQRRGFKGRKEYITYQNLKIGY